MPTEQKHYRKTMLALPPEVASAFVSFATAGDTEKRDAYMAVLNTAGWTLQSISDSAGVTRERVRQIVDSAPSLVALGDAPATLPMPEPPEHKRPEPRVFIEPEPTKLARLLELQPLAQKVRSNSPNYRSEAEEYTKLIAEVHLDDHVTLYRLAKRLGVTHGALRFRLARYGYKQPAKANPSSKVYTPILEKNRV